MARQDPGARPGQCPGLCGQGLAGSWRNTRTHHATRSHVGPGPAAKSASRWPDTEAGVKGRMALSLALHQTGDETAALQFLDVLQNPTNNVNQASRWTLLAGMLLRARWELPRAERLARGALQGTNRSAQTLNLLAEILSAQGQLQEAVELERQALAQDPGNEYYAAQLHCFQGPASGVWGPHADGCRRGCRGNASSVGRFKHRDDW